MIINVTDSHDTATHVELIDFDLCQLEKAPPHLQEKLDQRNGKMRTKLIQFMEYVRDHGYATLYGGKDYTGISIRKLSELYGGSLSTWQKYIYIWVEWGLLGRPNKSYSTNNGYEYNAMEYAKSYSKVKDIPNCKPTTMYTVTRWTDGLLQAVDTVALSDYGTGRKVSTIHRRGADTANKIWGDRRGIADVVAKAEDRITARVTQEITAKGYCTKADIMQKVHVKGINLQAVLSDMMTELKKKYRYGRPTKEQRERYKLSDGRYIFTAEDDKQ